MAKTFRLGLIFSAMAFFASSARADEADDALSRSLGAVVRDPRLSIWSRVDAVRTLTKLGPRATASLPDLVLVLNRIRGKEQEALQEAIIEAIGQIGSPSKAALPALSKVASRTPDIERAVRSSTDLILAASDAEDVEALLKQLISKDGSLRLRAVKALSVLGASAKVAVPAITVTLEDGDPDVRRAAIAALRILQPGLKPTEAMIRAIAVDLNDPDPGMRMLAVRTLGRLGSAATPYAEQIEGMKSNDPDSDVRKAATDAVSRILAAP